MLLSIVMLSPFQHYGALFILFSLCHHLHYLCFNAANGLVALTWHHLDRPYSIMLQYQVCTCLWQSYFHLMFIYLLGLPDDQRVWWCSFIMFFCFLFLYMYHLPSELRIILMLLAVCVVLSLYIVLIVWVRRQCWVSCPTVLPMAMSTVDIMFNGNHCMQGLAGSCPPSGDNCCPLVAY